MQQGTRCYEPASKRSVSVHDAFWRPHVDTVADTTVPYVLDRLEADGRVRNFEAVANAETDYSRVGRPSCDADLYKWLEGACYALEETGDDGLEARIERIVALVANAQEDDGYVNTYFALEEPDERWTNLGMMHELYVVGHLIEAGIAHRDVTGDETLLDVATRAADHVDETFGPEVDKQTGYPGHEELELALVRLYRAVDDRRYLDLAAYFVEERGRGGRFEAELDSLDEIAGGSNGDAYRRLYATDDGEYDGRYAQAHRPVRDQETVEGHAVKATYLYSAVADLAMETGDEDLAAAAKRLWEHMRYRRMYVTGGIGTSADNEGFTDDFDLPNHEAYAETCAGIGNVLWSHRLFQLTGNGRYADTMERALYNAVLPGISEDGTHFFYANPLASDGSDSRSAWFDRCPCCPTNVVRVLTRLEPYLYARSDDSIAVVLYAESDFETTVDGTRVTVDQETGYPFDGEVALSVTPEEPTAFDLDVRIPEWCREWSISVNGRAVDATPTNGIISLSRRWAAGDDVTLSLDLSVNLIESHPEVRANVGKVAVQRGPIVYCLEAHDNGSPLDRIALDGDGEFAAVPAESDDAADRIVGGAKMADLDGWHAALYRPTDEVEWTAGEVTAIPYYAWNERSRGGMRVWLRSMA